MTHAALRLSFLALAACAALLVAPSLARAQDARALVDRGLKAFDLTHWDEAIAAFEEAYRLEPEPDVLGLLGDAYRAKGDCARAAHAYRTNLELKPRTRRKKELEQRLAEMDACVAREREAAAARATEEPAPVEPEPTSTTPSTTPTTTPTSTATSTTTSTPTPTPTSPAPLGAITTAAAPAPHPGRGKRIAGVSLAATGAVAIGGGVLLGLAAGNRADDVEAHLAANGDVWDATAADLERRGQRLERASLITAGLGGAALVGGVVLYLVGAREGRAAEGRPLVRLGRGEAMGGWSWAF